MKKMMKVLMSTGLVLFCVFLQSRDLKPNTILGTSLTIENEHFRVIVDEQTGKAMVYRYIK